MQSSEFRKDLRLELDAAVHAQLRVLGSLDRHDLDRRVVAQVGDHRALLGDVPALWRYGVDVVSRGHLRRA